MKKAGPMAWGLAALAALAVGHAVAPAAPGGEPARVPLIYSTDLYHPHVDLDDHFDLAQVFAMPEFDVRAIILDVNGEAARAGRPAVEQMMALSGRRVPYVMGLKSRLKGLDDKALDQPAEFQEGVKCILQVLGDAAGPVAIITTGSARDVVAAFNRDPALCKAKIRGVYANIGNAQAGQGEYNVDLDVAAYRAILASGLPVFWFPCFPDTHPGATFWRFDYGPMFEADVVPAGLRAYFTYAMRKLDPRASEPVASLADASLAAVRPKGLKEMWCTPSLFAAAGRKVYRVGPDQWVAAAAPPPGATEEKVFEFVPARVELDDAGKPTKVEYQAAGANVTAFRRPDVERYGKAMNRCLLNLYRNFPVAGKAAEAKRPKGE